MWFGRVVVLATAGYRIGLKAGGPQRTAAPVYRFCGLSDNAMLREAAVALAMTAERGRAFRCARYDGVGVPLVGTHEGHPYGYYYVRGSAAWRAQ